MDLQFVESYLIANREYFPTEQMPFLRDRLRALPESDRFMVSVLNLRHPVVALILSIVVGGFGVDRFYIGDTGLGIGKLITLGGLGIWTVIDWFLIMNATKRKNMENFLQMV